MAERATRQRDAIRAVLTRSGRPLGSREILDLARSSLPKLGIATVYRTLARMLASGEIVAVEVPGQAAKFEPAGMSHHHHFHCDSCGRLYDLPGCPGNIERLLPNGFSLSRHDLLLYGRCAACGD